MIFNSFVLWNDDKIKYAILLVLFLFYFVAILPMAIGTNRDK